MASAVLCAIGCSAQAEIRTDGTLGGPALALAGPNFQIGEPLGRLSGSNLFHSFQVFNVGRGESATFVTTTPGLANVVSRVSGGSPSQINGPVRLAATGAAPNFVFVNPAGIVFGKGAEIDVPAAFRATTADLVRFPDGIFYADPARTSTLSATAPEAFGFLGTTRTAITIKDGASLRTTSPRADQPVSIVAGDIRIDNGGSVQTAGSDIRAIAVESGAQEIALAGPLPGASGELRIEEGSHIFSRSDGANNAGNVYVAAGSMRIDGSKQKDGFTGLASRAPKGTTGNAGNIEVAVDGTLLIVDGGSIDTNTAGNGRAGTVTIAAGTVSVQSGSVIQSSTDSVGTAGSVRVNAHNVIVDGEGSKHLTGIASQANGGSAGDAGNVEVVASDSLVVLNDGVVSSGTLGTGGAGSVRVRAGTILVDSDGLIGASAAAGSSGQTGTVTIEASDSITVSDGASLSIENSATVANPGSLRPTMITVTAPTIVLRDNGVITAQSYGNVDASNVAVNFGPRLTLSDKGRISASAVAGDGGQISIGGDGIAVLQNSRITTTSKGDEGNAGDISIRAPVLLLQTGFIRANTLATSGRGGTVDIDVLALVLSGSTLFLGGSTAFSHANVFAFNVIQAAAPDGVGGNVRLSTPALDIAGSLGALATQYLDSEEPSRRPCAIVGGSSLARVGRGGLPPPAGGLLWMDSVDGPSEPVTARAGSPASIAAFRDRVAADRGLQTIPCGG